MTETMNPASDALTEDGAATTLLELLELDELDHNLYRTVCHRDEPPQWYAPGPLPLYGGQVVAQALHAAGRTVPEDRPPHSLHGYFLRPGAVTKPIVFVVDRDRDGRSYSARRVSAIQDGKPIFTMSASFVTPRPSPDHEAEPAPVVPDPVELREIELPRVLSFEARQVPRHGSVESRFWARCIDDLPDSPLIHACVLAYLSDTNSRRFPKRNTESTAWGPSIDHALWFHGAVRIDEWLLTSKVITNISGGRGLYAGTVHDCGGKLVASMSQEGMLPTAP